MVREAVPNLPAAGKVFQTPTDGIAGELRMESRPPTPLSIARFRKSAYTTTGRKGLHWGVAADPPPPDMRFGRKNHHDDSVKECLRAQSASGFADIVTDAAESKYFTRRREPLGRTPIGNYELPQVTKLDSFAFGIKSTTSDNAKLVIYSGGENIGMSRDGLPSSKADPGYQLNRKYEWKADPAILRFGRNTLSDTVQSKTLFSESNSPQLIPIKLANHKAVHSLELGKPKCLGFGGRREDFVYGKSVKLDELNARGLISGGGQPLDLVDDTIGVSVCKSAIQRRQRAEQVSVASNKVFGIPTLRTDLNKPQYIKVTNNNNYGDDASAAKLLYPADSVGSDNFAQLKSLSELRALADAAGWGLNAEQISEAFSKASADNLREGDERISITSFSKAVTALGF